MDALIIILTPPLYTAGFIIGLFLPPAPVPVKPGDIEPIDRRLMQMYMRQL